MKQIGDCFLWAILVEEEGAKMSKRPGILIQISFLTVNGTMVSGRCVLHTAQPSVRQAYVIFRLHVPRLKLQTFFKGADRLFETVFVVFRAAQIVPAVRVFGIPLQ